MTLEDKIKNIEFNENLNFLDTFFILQNFISEEHIIDYQLASIFDEFSGKIKKLQSCSKYQQDSLFILLYSSTMTYNDLINPEIKNKIKLNNFIKMLEGCNNNNNFPTEFLTEIYDKIYDKIKEMNIKNNILHDKKIISDKQNKCILL